MFCTFTTKAIISIMLLFYYKIFIYCSYFIQCIYLYQITNVNEISLFFKSLKSTTVNAIPLVL